MVEVLTKYLKDVFDHDPRKPPRIRAYRGGYLPTERREAERAMRDGRIDGIVTTSALELGVDIGSLDVVVLNGYPGTVAATWQRFGRAGRRQQPSLGVLVASSQPLDQYVVRHPDFFADAPPEHARIAPGPAADPVRPHPLRCLRAAVPGRRGLRPDRPVGVSGSAGGNRGGAPRRRALGLDRRQLSGAARCACARWPTATSWSSTAPTAGRRSSCEVDYSAAALTLYEGAIHMVQSTPYQVERLDWEGRKAYVTRTARRLLHRQHRLHQAEGAGTLRTVVDAGDGDAHHGEVHVVRRVAGYKKIRYYTHENIGYGPVNLPDQELHTTAVWWQLPQAVLLKAFASKQDALDGFLGAAYALHVVATVAVMADARDLQKSVGNGDGAWFATQDGKGNGRVQGDDGKAMPMLESSSVDVQQFVPTVYLYDNFPGGVGLSEPLWQRQAELVQRAHELVGRCDCVAGCPACVGPVLATSEGRPLATPKSLALEVLDLLSAEAA